MPVPTNNCDAASDDVGAARPDILQAIQNINQTRVCNLRDYGANGNGGDCLAALNAAATAGAVVLTMPYIPGESNTVFFSAFDASAGLVGKTLDIDSRLTVSVPDNGIVGYPNSVGIRHARPTRYWIRDLQVEYVVMPEGGDLWYGAGSRRVMPMISDANVARAKATAITASGMTPRKIAWNNSDTWAADTYSSSTAAAAYFQPTNDASFHLACTAVSVGDEVSACLVATGTPLLACVVRHAGGFDGLMATADYTSAPSWLTKVTGSSGTSNSVQPLGTGSSHQTYSALGATWAVRILGAQEYAILWNGYEIVRKTTTGAITEVGFGGYPNASGQTIGVTDPVRVTGAGYRPGTLVSMAMFGDSKVANRGDAWAVYLRDALDHSLDGALRCWRLDNFAVAGTAVAAQRSVMAGLNMATWNVAVISIGTNDVQALTSLSTFDTDLRAMVTQCLAAGCKVVLGMPSLWYTQSQAGARGQASTNYGRAAPYRQRVMRIAADNSHSTVRVVDEAALHGPALAHYVNPGLSPSLVGAGDPVVYDNIHHTTRANQRVADSYARVIAGFWGSP